MSPNALLPEFSPQCCDAISYPSLGQICAEAGTCYGDLRPGGAYYWFSLPAHLGAPYEILAVANWLLLLLSSALATRLLLLLDTQRGSTLSGPLQKSLLIVACLAAHLVFLGPVLLTTLSDPPATLFFLIGVWSLLLSAFSSGTRQCLLVAAAGLCLGFAAWIRAFFLYPVLAAVAICLLASLPRWHTRQAGLLLLSALAFPALQVHNTYRTTGTWGYIGSDSSEKWTNAHLDSALIGYDTLLPNNSHFWSPQHCEARAGVLSSLKTQDYASAACILLSRAAFYTATYRTANYIYPDINNRLFLAGIEDVGNPDLWIRQNMDWQANAAPDPVGNMTADTLTALALADRLLPIPANIGNSPAYALQWVALPGDTDYTLSAWLWSAKPTAVELSITQQTDNATVAQAVFNTTAEPRRFSVSGRTPHNATYNVSIGIPDAIRSGPVHAWGAQLEEGTRMSAYRGVEPIVNDAVRRWHPWLLATNSAALVMALAFIICSRRTLLYTPAGLAGTAAPLAAFAQAILIIPEQRFAMAFMVFIWCLGVAMILSPRGCGPRGY